MRTREKEVRKLKQLLESMVDQMFCPNFFLYLLYLIKDLGLEGICDIDYHCPVKNRTIPEMLQIVFDDDEIVIVSLDDGRCMIDIE